ncbi:glutaredoxin [Georgenia sp. H159]|uniref:glutaredoxin n=1 Tax=Georgenia sp. H159 TaxID=3076115 RepID=UPI002D79F06D|nr:glutaredoxin [Georgenia sp. H159]
MTTQSTTTVVTVVQAPACHFCEDAAQVLADLAGRFALEVRTLGRDTIEGRRLIIRHRATMAPLVLVDGEYFSSGRLHRRRLEKLLHLRAAPAMVGH